MGIPQPPDRTLIARQKIGRKLGRSFFRSSPTGCARGLVGCTLVWGDRSGIIVETEAYAETGDPACHTAKRPSARAFIEKHPPGTAYVYFNYGVHWMLNVLVKEGTENGFVLIRALEPLGGLPLMAAARGTENPLALCSGPGKLAKALAVTGADHGRDLAAGNGSHFFCAPQKKLPEIVAGPRIGISSARDYPWRFCVMGSPFLSRLL